MQAIIDWFSSVSEVISNCIGFLADMVNQLVSLVKMLGEAALTIPKLFGIFPPVLTVSLAAVLAIAIAFKVLGRE